MAGRVASKSDQFMVSPLVVWLNTFDDFNAVKDVNDLADGVLLHKVMQTIDPTNCSMTKVNRSVAHDQGLRMQNLQLLVERIRNFYHTNMQQLIIGSLPNIVSICSSPESEYSLDQMEKLLILLLGCAVKCEPLVEKMKAMDPIQQQALVTNIKQVTHSTELVCSIDWDDLNEIPKQTLQGLCRTAYSHLQRVAKERDTQYDTIIEVSLEKDYYKQLHTASKVHENGLSPRLTTPTKSSPSVNTELLELKKRVRHLQEQLDHKSDTVIDLKEELEQARGIAQKLQQDKRELAEDAKTARAYRDEIEMLKVQSGKVEKLEADVVKYRQKAEDTEYLKKKIAGLKAENDLTVQTKGLLEQKIEALTSRSEALDDLQEQFASTKAQLESLQQEKEMDSEKIEELIARNAHLELEFKHYEERLAQLNMELETSRVNALEANSSTEASNLSFEMSEADMANRAKVIRLEKEAKEMEKAIELMRHAQAKCVELEKINKKLHTQTHMDRREIIKVREEVEVLKVKASRVDKLQLELNSQRERVEEAGRSSSKLKELKTKYDIVLEAKAKLEDEVDSLQSKVGIIDHLRDETASLKAQVDSHSTEHEDDQKRIQELLEQNAQLELEKQKGSEERESLKAQLLQLRSKSGPQAPLTMVSPPRYSEAEMASQAKLKRLEKETQEMEQTMEALRHQKAKCLEMEKANKKLMEQSHTDRKEITRLKQELHSSKAKSDRMNKLQLEMKSQEQQLEDVDAAKRKITELKQQNTLLSEARILLQEEVTGLQAKLDKINSSQADSIALKVRVEAMEMELQEESLRMQELIQQNVQLELDRDKKNEEVKSMSEEIMQLKLKQGAAAPSANTISPVHKPMSEEDLANRTKVLRLERDNRELERSLEVERQTNQRTSTEMEKMNRKLTATIHADKKEIARLKEELRRERASGHTRAKSVSDDTDFDQTKQVQELENKFKDAYSQSLSTKDERIQVLEKRVEEMTRDNSQLRGDLVAVRKQHDQLKEAQGAKGTSSDSTEAIRYKGQVEALHDTNTSISKNLADAKQTIQRLETSGQRQSEKISMLEKLNTTLEEEKKTMLTQLNKQLEKNQDLLVKTLETKDVALEDERIFNDRLNELERDKQRLQEQLAAHRRETLSRDMEYWRKTNSNNNKSKNILKKGFKKLKGKIVQGKSYKFDYQDGPPVGLAGSGPIGGSVGSTGSGTQGFHMHDGSMSSSQSISSSNSKQSEEQEEEEGPAAALESSGTPALIPRAATMDGSSPYLRLRNKNRNSGGSINLPGMGVVKLRHGSTHGNPNFEGAGSSGGRGGSMNFDPSKIPDDLMSLEDFLAESEKTPNRRRVMELNRASLVIGTPPATPRNSLMLTSSSSSQMFDLQEFLSKVEPSDSRSKRGTIHEVPENDPDQLFMQEQAAQYKASQHSIHSKSSTSLTSAHSVSSSSASVNRQGIGEGDHGGSLPVITNPAAMAGNYNNNNNNSNSNNNNNGSYSNSDSFAGEDGGPLMDIAEMLDMMEDSLQQGDSSVHSSASSSPSKGQRPRNASSPPQISVVGRGGSISVDRQQAMPHSVSTHAGLTSRGLPPPHPTVSHPKDSSKKGNSRPLTKRIFHRSSGNVRDKGASVTAAKPPSGKKIHRSSIDLRGSGESFVRNDDQTVTAMDEGPLSGLDLSDLTDLVHSGEMMFVKTGPTRESPVLPMSQLRPPEAAVGSVTTATTLNSRTSPRSPRIREVVSIAQHRSETVPDLSPRLQARHSNANSRSGSHHSSQESGELLSWEDFLDNTSPTHQASTSGPQAANVDLSEGDDSIWLEYGSV